MRPVLSLVDKLEPASSIVDASNPELSTPATCWLDQIALSLLEGIVRLNGWSTHSFLSSAAAFAAFRRRDSRHIG